MIDSGKIITSDNIKISYNHYQNGFEKVIIIAHGFNNSKDNQIFKDISNRLAEVFDVFIFDFRGHGKSEGKFFFSSKEDLDLKAIFEYLKPMYSKIGLIGFSFGAAISINSMVYKNPVDSLICVSAPSDVNKIDLDFWQLDWQEDIVYAFSKEGRTGKGIRVGPFWLKKRKPLQSIRKVHIPILFIHGNRDWVIRPWHAKLLFDNCCSHKKKLKIINGGLHAEYLMRTHQHEFIQTIVNWFNDTLAGGK
jgi:hypothetical protein